MSPGAVISGVGHVGLLAWLLSGWGLTNEPLAEMEVTPVSVVSAEEFAALSAPATATPEPSPEAQSEVAAGIEPETAEPAPEAPPAEEAPATPAPEPAPEAPAAEAPPPPEPEAPPEAVVQDVAPEPAPGIAPEAVPGPPPSAIAEAPRPRPRPAPRVAPEAAPPPPEDVEVAPEVAEAAEPRPAPEPPPPEEPPEAAAPEEAAPEIVTEAEEPGGAVEVARRPPSRPARPAPAAEPAEEVVASSEDVAEEPSDGPAAEVVASADEPDPAAAVEAALAAASAGAEDSAADPGPPMTEGERDAFRVAVQGCWNLGSLSSEAMRTNVTVAFELGRDGRVAGEVELLTSEGGSGAAVNSAFEAARRAILRCQGDGFPLPPEKFEQWRVVEMSFNPSQMAIR